MIRTLMIEDDTLLVGALRLLLEENGHQVQAVCTYRETMMQDFSSYDFFCVDIHLPDGNGIDICREIRRAGRQPILVLTAYEDEDYAVRAFEAGADDYVIKPFRSRELVARMSALLRRTCRKPDMKGYRCGDLFVSAESVEVRWQGKPLDVSALEYRILALLLRQAGGRVSRDDMLKQVWQNSSEAVEDNTLSVNVGRLRRKLERLGCSGAIETCWGRGYRWVLPVTEERR